MVKADLPSSSGVPEVSYEDFGKVRSYIWPIHRSETRKFVPMLLMCFLATFIYNILRPMKDSLIVTSAEAGAEVIPYLKVWAMLPTAILLTSIFVRLSHRYSSERVFYLMVSGFLLFFLMFTFVLYPLRDTIHPHNFAHSLQNSLPSGFGGLVGMIRFWSFSIFYAMAECWGVICLTILFWGFANETTSVLEATRFYGIFAIGGNFGSILAGRASYFLSNRSYNPNWFGSDAWHQSLVLLTLTVVVTGCVLIALFRWFNRRVVPDLNLPKEHLNPKLDKTESKASMRASFAYLMKSRYLLSIAVVVVSYNLFINLVEVLWKGQLKMLYPDPNAYNTYMANITTITGVIATLIGLFLSGNIIRKFGWTSAAMLTPLILFFTSIGFFVFYLFPDDRLGIATTLLHMAPLQLVVFFGSAGNCFSRAAKYSIFDETKEMTFIPLSRESRVKGKAAIDGVSSRAGKSLGSLIYQGMFMTFGGLSASVPYVAALLVLILGAWMTAVTRLGRAFGQKTQVETLKPGSQPAAPATAVEA